MIDDDLIIKVKEFALNNSEKDDIHGYSHIERVYNSCLKIGMKLNANLSILKISALLHDVGRIDEQNDELNRNHAEISAEKASKFLNSNNFGLSEKKINEIIHCIKTHSFSNKIVPNTLEAKILSDADKLDALGAIGLYRTIGFTVKNKGGLDKVIDHLENKILKLKNLLYLDLSKKIAEDRHNIVKIFYDKIRTEL